MLSYKILKHPDDLLNQDCRPVDLFDKELASTVAKLFTTMRRGNGVGLAAPQVGKLDRIIVIDTRKIDHNPFFGAMINLKMGKIGDILIGRGFISA